MSGYVPVFPPPTEEQRRALEVVSVYLERVSHHAASQLMAGLPGVRELELLSELRMQLMQSASVCATVLEVFDGWFETQDARGREVSG